MKILLVLTILHLGHLAVAQERSNAFPIHQEVFGKSFLPLAPLLVDPFDFQTTTLPRTIKGFDFKMCPTINHLPSLFCKLEYQLETKSKLAPRFRLGSLDYTEWMEGKRDLFFRN